MSWRTLDDEHPRGDEMGEMATVMALDAGGTSTRAVLVTAHGDCLGFGRSGAGNPISAGMELATRSALAACRGAWQQATAGRPLEPPVLTLLTMAGALSVGDVPGLELGLREAGLHGPMHFAPDVLSAYFSGTADSDGYVVIAGTGAVSGAVVAGDLVRVSDGLGWLLGDAGSGFWLGLRAVRAACADMDGRGPATALTRAVLDVAGITVREGRRHLRTAALPELVEMAYSGRPVEMSRYAPLVLEHPDDPVAADLIARAASLLGATARSVIDGDGSVVLAGGLMSHHAMRRAVERELADRRCLGAADGTVGAAILALRQAGVQPNASMHARLSRSIGQLDSQIAERN